MTAEFIQIRSPPSLYPERKCHYVSNFMLCSFQLLVGRGGNLPVFGHHRPVVYARPKQVKKNKKSTWTIIIISRGLRTFSLRTENIYKFPHMRPPVNERKEKKMNYNVHLMSVVLVITLYNFFVFQLPYSKLTRVDEKYDDDWRRRLF
jgi:hypothetical protein